MQIKDNIIEFKSASDMFYKEQSGVKSNTIRILTYLELDSVQQSAPKKIKIIHVTTGEYFIRKISDISYFIPHVQEITVIAIISWR